MRSSKSIPTSASFPPRSRGCAPAPGWFGCLLLAGGLVTGQPVAGETDAGQRERAEEDRLRSIYSQPPEKWPEPHVEEGVEVREIGPLPPVQAPEENPTTPARVELGRQLFFDPRLSGSGQIACASCHDSQLGWGDGRDQALGHDRQRGPRNAMTLLNVGHFERLFWDGRADGLEGQALKPITNPVEMHNTIDDMLKTLNGIPEYRREVEAIFGSETIDEQHVARALAAFQRTITSRTSRVDEFLKGDEGALSGQELRGLHLFRTKARCMNCHDGPLLSDRQFHNTGLHYYGRKYEDLGRYEVTGEPKDAGRFRTPSLRDVAITGPWMHNGLFPTLEGIINMYDAGGVHPEPDPDEADDPLFPETSPLLQPLELTSAEKEALETFLRALSETPARVRAPETLPPSE